MFFTNEDYPGVKVVFLGNSMRYCMNSTFLSEQYSEYPDGIEVKRALCQKNEVLAEQLVFFFQHLETDFDKRGLCAFCHQIRSDTPGLLRHFQKDHWEEVKSPLVKSASKA